MEFAALLWSVGSSDVNQETPYPSPHVFSTQKRLTRAVRMTNDLRPLGADCLQVQSAMGPQAGSHPAGGAGAQRKGSIPGLPRRLGPAAPPDPGSRHRWLRRPKNRAPSPASNPCPGTTCGRPAVAPARPARRAPLGTWQPCPRSLPKEQRGGT